MLAYLLCFLLGLLITRLVPSSRPRPAAGQRATASQYYGRHTYPRDHFAHRVETRRDDNFVLAIRKWMGTTPVDVIVILKREDCRGYRVIVELVNRTNAALAFNRRWSCAEELVISSVATLVGQAFYAIGLVPQTRRDGIMAVRYDPTRNAYEFGTNREPYRLFYHVIGRNLRDCSPLPGLFYADPGSQFTLRKDFVPWRSRAELRAVAQRFREELLPLLSQYGLVEYDEERSEALVQSVPSFQWLHQTAQGHYRRLEYRPEGPVRITETKYKPYVLACERAPLQPISEADFERWHQAKEREAIIYEGKQYVVWIDLKQDPTNRRSIYWVLWFREARLVTWRDLGTEHLELLRDLRAVVEGLLRERGAQDFYFDIVFHDPPTVGRLHAQIVPRLYSHHFTGTELLYTQARFTLTLEHMLERLVGK